MKNKFFSVALEDQILWRDRWIFLLMLLCIIFTAWIVYEVTNLYIVPADHSPVKVELLKEEYLTTDHISLSGTGDTNA